MSRLIKSLWQSFIHWLLRDEIMRLNKALKAKTDDLHHQQNFWRQEYKERRGRLEMQYAVINKENEYLKKCLFDSVHSIFPPISIDPTLIVAKSMLNMGETDKNKEPILVDAAEG